LDSTAFDLSGLAATLLFPLPVLPLAAGFLTPGLAGYLTEKQELNTRLGDRKFDRAPAIGLDGIRSILFIFYNYHFLSCYSLK